MDNKTLSFVILFLAAAFIAGTWLSPATMYMEYGEYGPVPAPMPPIPDDAGSASIHVPAVDAEGNGIITRISVQAMPGTGRILTNIDKILFWVDTQHSIRLAKQVAENVTGLDTASYDLIYTITADASIIEGPSAGAAMTVATIAALEGRDIRGGVMITGSIEDDGSIGSAAGIKEKATAARDRGATTFLIPEGAVQDEGTEREVSCSTMDGTEYCEVEYVHVEESVGEEVGIEVKEVSDITEVLEAMLE